MWTFILISSWKQVCAWRWQFIQRFTIATSFNKFGYGIQTMSNSRNRWHFNQVTTKVSIWYVFDQRIKISFYARRYIDLRMSRVIPSVVSSSDDGRWYNVMVLALRSSCNAHLLSNWTVQCSVSLHTRSMVIISSHTQSALLTSWSCKSMSAPASIRIPTTSMKPLLAAPQTRLHT